MPKLRKILLEPKDYAKICLECPNAVCHCNSSYGCDRLKPFKERTEGTKCQENNKQTNTNKP